MRKLGSVLLLLAFLGLAVGCNTGPGNPSRSGTANPGVAPVGSYGAPAPVGPNSPQSPGR